MYTFICIQNYPYTYTHIHMDMPLKELMESTSGHRRILGDPHIPSNLKMNPGRMNCIAYQLKCAQPQTSVTPALGRRAERQGLPTEYEVVACTWYDPYQWNKKVQEEKKPIDCIARLVGWTMQRWIAEKSTWQSSGLLCRASTHSKYPLGV